MKRKLLPETYLEHVQLVRPELYKLTRAQAPDLLASGVRADFSDDDELGSKSRLVEAFGYECDHQARIMSKARKVPYEMARELIRMQASDNEAFRWIVTRDYQLLLRFFMAGEKIFLLSDGLANRLMHTDMRAPCELVRLPYPTIAIVSDAPEVIEAMYAADKKRPAKTKGAATAILCEMNDERGRRLVIHATHHYRDKNLMVLSRSMQMIDGTTTDDALATDWLAQSYPRDSIANLAEGDDDVFLTELYLFIRLLLNTVMYMSSENAVVSPQERSTKPGQSDASLSSRLHQELGRGFTPIAPPGQRSYRTDKGLVTLATPDVVSRRVLVMGHYRNQAHGPGRTLRKLMWIEPFWRGPDAAEVVNRPHLLH